MKITHCMNCMEENKDELAICPHCGFNEEENPSLPHQLPYRTVLNGKYMVGKAIGEGGFGITYIGWDLNLGIKVAIKEFYPEGFVGRTSENSHTVRSYQGDGTVFFNKGKDKFLEEARSLGKFMSLPGIVSVKDFFLQNNTVYIVMEYLDGQSIKAYAKEHDGRIEKNKLLEFMKPVIKSLTEVHKAGIIHRDISPDNIMICKDGQMKLIDFGAARETSPDGEKTMSVMLKKGYSPEEQYRTHGEQGTWTDVYALCATIYAMLTGVKPDEPLDRMENDTLKRPSEYGIKLSKRQEDVLMKGLAVKAQDRVQTMDDLYRGLYCDGKDNEFEVKNHKLGKWIAAFVAMVVVIVISVVLLILPVHDTEEIQVSGYKGITYDTADILEYLPDNASNVRFRDGNIESREFIITDALYAGDIYELEVIYEVSGREHIRPMNIKVNDFYFNVRGERLNVPVGQTIEEAYQVSEYGWSTVFDYPSQSFVTVEILDDIDNTVSGEHTVTAILKNEDREVARTSFIVEYHDVNEIAETVSQKIRTYCPNLYKSETYTTYANAMLFYFKDLGDWDAAINAVCGDYPNAEDAGYHAFHIAMDGQSSIEELVDKKIQETLNSNLNINEGTKIGVVASDMGYYTDDEGAYRLYVTVVVFFGS